ncbi:MAG: peptidylprolyl isomerase [Bdellovibrionales bacterium]|nr:peptidylprolyl isomerase [Bdellovibrionales bacterium]
MWYATTKQNQKRDDKTKSTTQTTGENMYAVINVTKSGSDIGSIKIKLFDKRAPKTVANFTELSEGKKEFTDAKTQEKKTAAYYDGIIFHRVINNFMIQTGDPTGTGMGGPGYQFEDEFHPELRHNKAGILSMANSGPGTNGSQFFITLVPTPHLDDRHSVFGEVVEGLDVVKAIGLTEVGAQDKPVDKIEMKSVKIIRE